MYKHIHIFLLSLYFVWILADLTVEQYDELINNSIEKTKTFEYPTDSRAFIQGTVNSSVCNNGGNYDVIIVGAGATGSVIANRLSELSHLKILILEAGGEENDFSDIPAMVNYLWLSDFNWGYKSVSQNNSLLGYIDRSEVILKGKVLGGSTTINNLMYARGNKQDFDKWANAGNPGWSYADVLGYFKKSENATMLLHDFAFHGHKGPLQVQDVNILSPLSMAFLEANQELGKDVLDYNGKDQIGCSRLQIMSINGKRNSGAKAFLWPARNRSNLLIHTNALVLKVLMEGNKATGVQYVTRGKQYCAHASEIVLSAGGINTPQLLMLSGIGPKEHLQENGIKLIKDLPTGENLWDHISLSLLPFTTDLEEIKMNLE